MIFPYTNLSNFKKLCLIPVMSTCASNSILLFFFVFLVLFFL